VAQQQAAALQQMQPIVEQFMLAQTAQQMKAQGADDNQVAMSLAQMQANMVVQRERQMMEAQRMALQIPAKQIVAQELAKRYSAEGLTINPQDLMEAPTPEAMEAKARTLNESYRRFALQQRASQGVDNTPGEGGSTSSGDDDWWLKGSSREVWRQAFSRKRR